jgi:DNA topoisomerase-1
MKLLIVESPAKAKTISKYLDGKYRVVASIGHIRDLPKSNKKAIDIAGGFVPHYEISPGKEKVVDEIRSLAAKADEIILATDPDREGEAIAWHIAEATGLDDPKNGLPVPKRVVFHEITKGAVQEAIEHPREIDQNLRRAQEARRVLDRLVGYDLSGLIWKKVRYGLSAGRVQSPALRIVMEREREIRAFKSHKFWVIEADVATTKNGAAEKNKNTGEKFTVTCTEEPTDFTKVEKILDIARGTSGTSNKTGSVQTAGAQWHTVSVEESEVNRTPRAPFITSTLQQTASSRLGFAPSRTMSIAQRLYEAGLITYMRTDSTNLSKVALAQAAVVIEKRYGKNYHQFRTYASKSKNAQEAHEAIRPTNLTAQNAGHNDEQKKLYRLIWQRTLACQMADAKMLRTKILANVISNTSKNGTIDSSEKIPDFAANGSRTIFDGWLAADPEARGDDTQLPKVVANDPLDLVSTTANLADAVHSIEKETQPPPRYTEAGLVKELEKRGIGRPSTYASIIRTIEDRGYVEKENKALKPTDTGDVVSSFLEENFMKYINDSFTAEMEDSLDDIALGKRDYAKTLKDFYTPFAREVKEKESSAKLTNLGDADIRFKCPICGSPMIIKLGRGGKFLSCSRYPDCTGALMMDGMEIKKTVPIGHDPATSLPIYVLVGRFGPYVQLGEKMPKAKKVKKPRTKKIKKTETTKEGELEKLQKETIESTVVALPTKPRMASIPKGTDLSKISVADALRYLSLPRLLGNHPIDSKPITASAGRFGPYIVHDGDFRSLKKPDDVYTVTLARALEILVQPKATRKGAPIKVRVIGVHPKTGKDIVLYRKASTTPDSTDSLFFKRGFQQIFIPKGIDPEKMTVEQAVEILTRK